MQQLIDKLKQIASESPNGFTVYTFNLQPVTKGWIVAMKETQNCFGDAGLKKALEVAIKTSNVIGGWKEGKKWYWDASLVYDNEDEATKAGIENEQIAIYHIETSYLKYL